MMKIILSACVTSQYEGVIKSLFSAGKGAKMKKVIFPIVFIVLSYCLWADVQPCTSVCTAPFTQTLQRVVPDGTGGAIVAWEDLRNGVDFDIYAQRIDNWGNMLWSATPPPPFVPDGVLVCGPPFVPSYQGHLCITPSGPDFIIAWEDSRNNPLSTDIYAQKIDLFGNLLWGPLGLPICVDQFRQLSPQICPDGANGAYITWMDDRANPGVDWDIYVQQIGPAGNILGPLNGALVSFSPWSLGTQQNTPQICYNNMGGAIIAYESVQPNTVSDIYAMEITPGCIPGWLAECCVCNAMFTQSYVQIVSDQALGAIICWEDYRNGVGCDIYASGVSGGAVVWPPLPLLNGIPVAVTTGLQYEPSIVSGGPNTALIAWRDNTPPNADIMAQSLTANAALLPLGVSLNWGVGGAVVCNAVNDQLWPQACPDGANGMIVSWEDMRNQVPPNSQIDIFSEQLNAAGVPQSGNPGLGFGICTQPNMQRNCVLANNQLNEAICVWQDDRNSAAGVIDWDLYTLDQPDPNVPVELSSFAATVTAENFAQINWTTQSETDIAGYYLQRNTSPELTGATLISGLVQGTNTSSTANYSYLDEEVMGGNTYYYWLQSVEYSGGTQYFGPVSVALPEHGDINFTPEIPLATGITAIFPNPFNPQTTITLGVLEAGQVDVTVYNVRGEKVQNLFSGYLEQGTYRCSWYGRDESGRLCPSGIYYVKMNAGHSSCMKKAVLSK